MLFAHLAVKWMIRTSLISATPQFHQRTTCKIIVTRIVIRSEALQYMYVNSYYTSAYKLQHVENTVFKHIPPHPENCQEKTEYNSRKHVWGPDKTQVIGHFVTKHLTFLCMERSLSSSLKLVGWVDTFQTVPEGQDEPLFRGLGKKPRVGLDPALHKITTTKERH